MNQRNLHKFLKALHTVENNMMTMKGTEYATKEDRFRNFKNMQHLQVSPDSPEACAWNVMAKHLEASMFGLEQLADNHCPSIEFWREKLGDIRIYCALILAMLEERDAASVKI